MPADTRKTIAVVEDNPDNLLLARILLGDSYHLNEYTTGKAALNGIMKNPPDLVLMDISLPDIDGVTIMKRLRAKKQFVHLPVFAVTAHAMRGDRERFLKAGFDYYMSKPLIDSKALLYAIETFIGEHEVF